MNKKSQCFFLTVLLVLTGILQSQQKSDDFPILKGPYLGQKPPRMKAEIFMEGFISTKEKPEMNAAFTQNGKEFYYCTRFKDSWAIFFTREINSQWIKPEPIHFASERFVDRDLTISPDEKKIYFGSNRPQKIGDKPLKKLNIFYIEKLQTGEWSYPRNSGKITNGTHGGNYPCAASNGNLYFFTSKADGIGKCDIYMTRFANDQYYPPVCLDTSINSKKNDWDAFIAPDESYIIFSSQNRPDTLGDQDLYISYRKKNGEWTKAKNMGEQVNSVSSEICPSVTLDGKYLFFTSRKRGNADIYWTDTKIIEELKSKELKRGGYSFEK